MNKDFNAILTALRDNNGMAIDSHNNTEIKIEAIANYGTLAVVGMPADVPFYSINSMYVNKDGRAVVSGYAWAVMGPEIIQESPEQSAEEFNKPQYHTPGFGYSKLTDVTRVKEGEIEIVVRDHEHLVYQLGLNYVENNPLPHYGRTNLLSGSSDNRLFLSATQVPTGMKEFGKHINDNMLLGTAAIKKVSDIQIEASTTETFGIESRDWYQKALRNCPNLTNSLYAVFRDVFNGEPDMNAVSFSFVTNDGFYVTITEIESRQAVEEKHVHAIITGDIIQARVDVVELSEALESLAREKAEAA
jgi:hypothetical protein